MTDGYHYLASPYSHSDPRVMRERYEEAMRATAWLLRQNIWVYSPIVHCHEIAVKHNLPRDYEFWKEYNQAMLTSAETIHVLCLHGWQESRGVQDEVLIANNLDIPVRFLLPLPGEIYDVHTDE